MGGLAGHMMHPHDNSKLTIRQFKDMISRSVRGEVKFKEKLDGFNIHIAKVDGKLVFARNGKDLANGGFTPEDMVNRFSNERIREIFEEAYDMLENDGYLLEAMDELADNVVTYNCEIIIGKTNVIDYTGIERIIIHNAYVWAEDGDKYTVEHTYNPYTFDPVGFPKEYSTDYLTYDKDYIDVEEIDAKVDELFKQYGLGDNATIEWFMQMRFVEIILRYYPELANQSVVVNELYQRIIHHKVGINLRQLRTMSNIDWDFILDKETVKVVSGLVRQPLEKLVLKIGTIILDHVHGYLNERNKYAVQYDLYKSIPEDADAHQLKRWENCDNKIFALEGVVFEYEGDLYKWTGPFAPLNQMIGGRR